MENSERRDLSTSKEVRYRNLSVLKDPVVQLTLGNVGVWYHFNILTTG